MFAKYQQNSSQKIREISKIFSRSLKQLPSWLDIVRQKISNISLPKIKKQTKTAWKKTLSFSEINIRKIKNLKKEDLKRIFSKDYLSQILKTIYQIETKQKIIFSLVLLLIGGVFGIIKHNQSTMIPDAVFRRSVLSSWDYTSDSNESGMTTKLKKEKSALAVLISREKSQIEFKLPINNPSLKVQDNTATYTNEDQSIEIKYEIQPTKLKESIILNSPTSKSEFTSNFTVRNLIVKVNNENIPVFFDTKNNYQFHLERPFATDAAGKTTFDLVYELKPKTTNAKDNPFKKKTFVSGENLLKMESLSDIQVNTNEYELIVSVDPSWLNAPDRQYPVIIDPTVTHDTTAEFAVGSFSRLIDSGSGSSPVLETYYQESIADEHTVLLWHMNETANDTCPSSNDSCDASGTGNHGSATGTTIGTGKISYGRTFNGTSDYISVADTNSLDLVKDYTLETWIYPTVSGNSTYRVFLAKRPSSGGNYELYLNNDAAANQGELRFWNGVTEYATGYVPKINTWTHIAAVVTNTTNLTMYVNGEVVSSQTIAAPVTFTGSFTIGRGGDIANYYFQGSIDEVRVSNIARSQEEIKMSASRRPYAVYTSDVIDLVGSSTVWDPFTWTESGVATGNGETLKNSTGLVAQWNFNETSGTTADNTEGTATYDGTLSGFDSKASQDADQDSGWTANNKRWGAGALQFDGIDSVVSIGAGKFDVLTDVSIEMWLKYAGSFSTNQVFFSRYKDGNNRMPIFVSSSTRKIAFENIVGGVNRAIYSDATINPGSWYHLVFSCGAGGMKMYVNGVQQTSTNATTDCFSTIAATVSNDIGAHNSSAYFPGTIDSTRIYSRELTAAEILSNYNSTNIEIQTRVGHNNAPYSEAWEDWSPTSGETTINNLDDYSPIGCSAVGGTTTDGGKTYVFTKNDTIVYGYTGSDQTYTVPAGVTSIDVEMWGGGGGGGNAGGWSYGFAGGGGGYTTGTLAVTPGQVLTVMVGAGGTNGSIANTNPSYGGGARSCNTGTDCRYGGQGGGRSAIRYSSADVITAGGGGGGGSSRVATGELGGGGGGNAGADGSSYTTGCRGRGGTQSAGGAGGSCGGSAGTAGSQYTGGNPASNSYGGGGGGGYYGGGGGGYFKPNDMGGGGGGSGYIGGAGGITVTNGTTTAAGGATPGNSSDLDNARSGTGGAAANNGVPGRVIITPRIDMSFTCTSSGNVEVLVVAGGGGGGFDMGGGGGGGGVIHNQAYPVVANTPITVNVGAGGAGAPAAKTFGQYNNHQYTIPATNGHNSVFGTLTAIGGGAGGSSYYAYTPGASGASGGSGGGSSGYSSGGTLAGGVGTVGQGFNGGQGGGQYYSGGGGGAGGPGTSSTAIPHGGIGYYSDILGTGYFWGGGGGGAGYTICGGNGGPGGGGGGAVCTTRGGSGLNKGSDGGGGTTVAQTNKPGGDGGENTGGGGGAGAHYKANNRGGNGGSGIVIVRLSPLTKDTNIKSEGTGAQKITTGAAQPDANTVGLWHFEETGGTSAYLKDSSTKKSVIYNYTGSDQTFVVPAGITSIDVEMWGGGGGGGNAGGWSYGFEGGNGGYTKGTLAVTPGQSLTVMVGAGGTNGSIVNTNPSYGGGGRSCNTGSDCRYGGQGGGRSAIRYSSADVITAGGGGGGGASRATNGSEGGAGGGISGSYGTSYTQYPNSCGGGGGTQSAGGAAGSCGGSAGTAGSQYTGGNPASNSYGGGGGGGYYGGGGGGYFKPNDMGGGGGGSGYIGGAGGITVTNGTTTAAGGATQGIGLGGAASTNGTNGKVIVSYTTTDRNHATPTGTTVTNGISGKARSFNGSSDFVLIPASSNLDVQNLTIEAWVYSDNFNQSGFIFEKTTNGLVNTQYSCFFNNTNTFYFRTHNTTPTQDDLTLTTNSYFVNGSWNHVACTYDGVNKKVYVNGAEAATKAYTQTLQTNPAGTAIIGAYGSGTSYFFNGKIDEVKISNVGRSAEEIAESYRAGRDKYISLNNFSATDLSSKASLPFYIAADRPGTYLTATIGESNFANYQPDANTVALWHLDERSGSGAYIKDSSDNANNGSTTSTTHVEGKIGKGRLFSNSSIALSSGSNANVTGDITLDMWIKPNSFAAAATPIHKDSQYSFQINTSGQVSWADSSNWNYAAFGATNIGLTTGNWQHLAFTKTGGTVKIYLNGVEKASKSFGGALTSTANIMNMGCYSGVSVCGSAYFNGSLDEVRISNIARSASEIRQAYEVGLRSHPITIDFAAIGAVSNVISSSTDTSFNIDATAYGLSSKGSGIYKGDKIIVRENYNGTEYIAQGTVRSVTPSIGAITVSSWDAASTFPAGGFTENADFFKWQQEYWPLTNNTISSHMDGINTLTLKQTDGQEGRTIWLDSFRSGNYLTNPAGSTLTSSLGRQYLQYRAIFSSFDPFVSPSLSMVSFAATTGPTPYLTPTPMPAYDGDTGGVQGASSCYLEESRLDNSVTLHWTDGATDEIGYEIEKQINNAEEWQFVDITTPNAQSYSDTDVAAGNIYRYRVRKRGDDGATGDWCGTQVIDMRTGNAQIEGLKIQGVRID